MCVVQAAQEGLALENQAEILLLRATVAHLHARLAALEASPPTLAEVFSDISTRVPDAIVGGG